MLLSHDIGLELVKAQRDMQPFALEAGGFSQVGKDIEPCDIEALRPERLIEAPEQGQRVAVLQGERDGFVSFPCARDAGGHLKLASQRPGKLAGGRQLAPQHRIVRVRERVGCRVKLERHRSELQLGLDAGFRHGVESQPAVGTDEVVEEQKAALHGVNLGVSLRGTTGWTDRGACHRLRALIILPDQSTPATDTMPTTMAQDFSENVRRLSPSATIAVSSLAKELRAQGRDIINLSAGEPDFATPGFIRAAAVAAIGAGKTRYTPAAGLPELKSAIARDLGRSHGVETGADGVVVSAGAKQALFNALFVLTGPGDRVLIPVPYWTSYPEIVQLARAEPVPVRGSEENGYRVGPEELDAVWDPSVRAVILNSPSNPSGSMYRQEELEAIARWARDRGVWLISDEIYARLCYVADRAPGLLDLSPDLREQAVVINGASKAFAMTGWRIGYSYTAPDVAARMSALQSHTTSNAATPSQHAALAAFTATADQAKELKAMATEFRARRDLVVERLQQRLPDTGFVAPEGAFYLFFRVDRWFDADRPDSVALCKALIEEAGVALVPGSAFGDDRYVRLSFAASRQELEAAFERLEERLGG